MHACWSCSNSPISNQIFGCSFGRLWNYGLEFMSNKVFFLGYVNVKGTFHFIVLSRLWERTFECSIFFFKYVSEEKIMSNV